MQGRFGLLPSVLHLFGCGLFKCESLLAEDAFQQVETLFKLAVSGIECDLRVDFSATTEVDGGEEKISEFFFHSRVVIGQGERVGHLGCFFPNFFNYTGVVGPIKAYFGNFFGDFEGLERSAKRLATR